MDEQFVQAVREMRQWQKAYFAKRTHEALVESKIAENKVDRLLEEFQSGETERPY